MRLVPSFRRVAFAGLALSLLCLLAACKSSSSSPAEAATTITVSGTITYTRIPVAKDVNGVPVGLESDPAKFVSLPARGVQVRFYNSVEEIAPDGSKVTVWKYATADSFSDLTGKYTATVKKDTPVFVEVISRVGTAVRLIADPSGMNSSLNQSDRPLYLLRKGLNGAASDTNPTPGTASSANATVDFTVGLQDKWWIGVTSPTLVGTAVRETQGTGSRVLGILDSIFTFQTLYGRVIPSGSAGDLVDLHYRPGISEVRGSYVEYDRNLFPQAFDSFTSSRHFFGSLRGGAANDDGWDEAVIWTLFARNYQAFTWSGALKPVGQQLTHLAPDLALAEGLAFGMTANLLKSPYLADTQGAGANVIDIRDLHALTSEQKSPYSAPAIAALTWELLLAGNSITAPGTPTTWSTINTGSLVRFFAPLLPRDTADSSKAVDTLSIFGQISRLQESQAIGETVNLMSIFTDAVLTPLVAPFGLTWPRPTTGDTAKFLLDWGTDPNTQTTPIAAIPFSMAKAIQVNGTYPNASEREVAFAQFYLTKDMAFAFNVLTQPANLPAGVTVEVYFPSLSKTFAFTGTGAPVRLTIPGNSTTPIPQLVRVRLVSPGQIAPDIQATLQFVPTS